MTYCVNFVLSAAVDADHVKREKAERARERERCSSILSCGITMKNILSAIHERKRLGEQALVVFLSPLSQPIQ